MAQLLNNKLNNTLQLNCTISWTRKRWDRCGIPSWSKAPRSYYKVRQLF